MGNLVLIEDENLFLLIIRDQGDRLCTADEDINDNNKFEIKIGEKIFSNNMGLLLELENLATCTNINTNFTSQTKLQKLIRYKQNNS